MSWYCSRFKRFKPEPIDSSNDEFFLAKILDTSAIIDGRISDVSEVGFLEGTIILPQFL